MEVYCVFANGDFTEGRGPMYLHSIYAVFEVAEEFVMSEGGISGSKQERNLSLSHNDHWYYNGYEIRRMWVTEESAAGRKRRAKKEKIASLRKELAELERN